MHFLGNHDRNNSVKSYITTAILEFGGKVILAQHHPPINESEIPKECDLVLCGHVHGKWKHQIINKIPIINVGVDVWEYKPVSIHSILKLYGRIINGKA